MSKQTKPSTQTPLPKLEKIERLVYIAKTLENNQKIQTIKTQAKKDDTTIYTILDEATDDWLLKQHLKPNGQPIVSLLNFGVEQTKKYAKCYFPKCKTPTTYQAHHSQVDKIVGLCKEHAQTIHKASAAKTNKDWPWKNLTHQDAPNQPLCDLCVEISLHTLIALPSQRRVPLCPKHYWAVQESMASGNKKWQNPSKEA
ncbi:hypothetical protein [Candidatus Bathycorpusculum sp.]|uniref:hypothetical protein n=1 Tax=Candidatus Bathycorpusculum sp. TaxID=2994959 RepID=UPI00282815F1|nr:hypothetical protein [Candidatus Termitimicrobium sp.]MCL2432080.1 hypothetical protein [Candidatus Termitimicrobium sp.]